MEPTSPLLLVLLFGSAAALLVGVARLRAWWFKAVAGAAALALALVAGIAAVNDNYGYYQTWTELAAGLTNSQTGLTGSHETVDVQNRRVIVQAGQLLKVDFPGQLSGIDRGGFVYLPAQYSLPAYRHFRFPVVELFHGTPGAPNIWLNLLHVSNRLDTLIATHQVGPMVLVMPDSNPGNVPEECLNSAQAQDETYVTRDVVADVEAKFRVATNLSEWAMMGYSSGGYCAANLALRHEGTYGAAAVLDGYFAPNEGEAAGVLAGDPAALAANDPLAAAQKLAFGAAPLTPMWVSAGTGTPADYRPAAAFVSALRRVEKVSLLVQPGAKHNFYAWLDAEDPALTWIWQQIATPEFKTMFPTGGPADTSVAKYDPRSTRTYGKGHHAPVSTQRKPHLKGRAIQRTGTSRTS